MIARKFSVIFLALMLAFTLAACGGDDDDNGGGDNGGGTANLSQTITSESGDGTLTVSYPEGWAANAEGGTVNVASSQDFLTLVGDSLAGTSLPENQVGGQIVGLPSEAATSFGTDLAAIMTGLTATFVNQGDGNAVAFSDPQEFTINGKSAVASTGDGTFDGVEASVSVIIVQDGDNYIVAVFVAHQGDLSQFEDEARAITGSASIVPAAG